MRRLILACFLATMLALAACAGGSPGGSLGGSTITMGVGVFTGTTQVTIKAGGAVTFDDSSGSPHDLVIGTNGMFTAMNGAPSQLNNQSGLMFNGGDKQTIVFATAGTYPITCEIHPRMQATVTVTP